MKKGFKLRYLKEAVATHRENSKDFIEYSKKIAKNAKYGKKKLVEVNPQVLKELSQSKFDNKILFNKILFNDFLSNLVRIYLLKTDKIRLLYNFYFYKYYLFYINYKSLV